MIKIDGAKPLPNRKKGMHDALRNKKLNLSLKCYNNMQLHNNGNSRIAGKTHVTKKSILQKVYYSDIYAVYRAFSYL